jgi:hypothetical protein
MQISTRRSLRGLAVSACAITAIAAAPAAANAASVTSDLRVEAGGKTLVPPGFAFATDSVNIKTDRREPACGGSGRTLTLDGPNALGLLVDASKSRRSLKPVGVSDKFSFGLFVCGIGRFMSDATSFWLYKVDHKSPEVGADQLALTGGEEVLWYRSTATQNTGAELAIEAPARATGKGPFDVTVVAYDFAGKKTPAAGATVRFPGGSATAGADGRASVNPSRKAGLLKLRATRGVDIPTGPVTVCIGARRLCPVARGKRIFGSSRADELKGTRGSDVVRGGAGNDRIDVRRGGRDKVKCGKGRDRVLVGKGDRAARDCEYVNGKARGKRRGKKR